MAVRRSRTMASLCRLFLRRRLRHLSLSDAESSESLDSEELLVDSDNESDEELDDWRREHLLPEARSDVVTRGGVVGSPAMGLQATMVAMPPTVEPAGAKRCARPFAEGVASSVDGEESDSLPSSTSARTGWFRYWNRWSTGTSSDLL